MIERTLEKDKSLELKFTKQIKAILGNQFIIKDADADYNDGKDFLVFNFKPFSVGVRLRRYEFLKRYPKDFTIRWSRPNGKKTEYAKIMQGDVDYLFYGFVDEEEKNIVTYFIGDLDVFRKENPNPICLKKMCDAEFAVFNIDQFSKDFIKKMYVRQS